MASAFTGTASGGWGFNGDTFDLGINSGSGGIGFGISNLNDYKTERLAEWEIELLLDPQEDGGTIYEKVCKERGTIPENWM